MLTSGVREQVAIEMLRSHWGKKYMSGVSEETVKILKAANLLESTALESCLDDALRNKSMVQNIGRQLQCIEEKVEENVIRLQEQLGQKELELGALKREK